MRMMQSNPADKNPAGKLSVLERALSKKQKPMKQPMSRKRTSPDFVKNSGGGILKGAVIG